MAFNPSKARSPRAWAKVRESGGVGTVATAKPGQRTPRIVPVEELRRAARIQRMPLLELNSKFFKKKASTRHIFKEKKYTIQRT